MSKEGEGLSARLLLVLPLVLMLTACDPPGPPRVVDHVDGCDVWYLPAEDIYVTKCSSGAPVSTDWQRLRGKVQHDYHSSTAGNDP